MNDEIDEEYKKESLTSKEIGLFKQTQFRRIHHTVFYKTPTPEQICYLARRGIIIPPGAKERMKRALKGEFFPVQVGLKPRNKR